MQGRLDLRIPPDWNAAKSLWDPCMAFFREHGLDHDESYALTMATEELLENAVKYGAWNDAVPTDILVTLEVEGRAATVEVHGPINEDPVMIRKLDDTIQWIRGFQSPFEAYVERLKQVSAQSYVEGVSGLGLTRIAYEARCLLDFYVTAENRLAMSAVYQPGGAY